MYERAIHFLPARVGVVGLDPASGPLVRVALGVAMRAAAEPRLPLSLVYVRLERLGELRDSRGERAAEALVSAAEALVSDVARLAARAARTGILGRVEEDALALILPGVDELFAELVAGRIEERGAEAARRAGVHLRAAAVAATSGDTADALLSRAADATLGAGRGALPVSALAA